MTEEDLTQLAEHLKDSSIEYDGQSIKYTIDASNNIIEFNNLGFGNHDHSVLRSLHLYPKVKIQVKYTLEFYEINNQLNQNIISHFDMEIPIKVSFTGIDMTKLEIDVYAIMADLDKCVINNLSFVKDSNKGLVITNSKLRSFEGISDHNMARFQLGKIKYIGGFDEVPASASVLSLTDLKEGLFHNSLRLMLIDTPFAIIAGCAPQVQLLEPFIKDKNRGDIYDAAAVLIDKGYDSCAMI